MKLNRIIGRAAAIGAMSLLFAGLNSNLAKAQETQPANMAKTQAVINKDSWETWKQDMKIKFQQVREQADKIKSDAQAKSALGNQALKDAWDKYETDAKTLSDKWSGVDQVTPENRESYKKDVDTAWDKVKASFDALKSQWDSINKK